MIRVALVDDQELFRAGLRFMLDKQSDIEVVGEAEDGEDGVELVRRQVPDVVLLDVRMPRLDGVEVGGGRAAGAPPPNHRCPRRSSS